MPDPFSHARRKFPFRPRTGGGEIVVAGTGGAEWLVNEGPSKLLDTAGSGTATLNGGYKWVRQGNLLVPEFNGTNTYADAGTGVISDAQHGWIMYWVYFKKKADIFVLGRGLDGSGSGWSLSLGATAGGTCTADCVAVSGGAGQFTATGTTIIPVGRWTCIAGCYSHSAFVKCFVNGRLDATTTVTKSTWRSSTVGVRIGNAYNSTVWSTGLFGMGLVLVCQSASGLDNQPPMLYYQATRKHFETRSRRPFPNTNPVVAGTNAPILLAHL